MAENPDQRTRVEAAVFMVLSFLPWIYVFAER
jgi:hypothetical protein